jgi:hypothetical protein
MGSSGLVLISDGRKNNRLFSYQPPSLDNAAIPGDLICTKQKALQKLAGLF